MEDISNEKTCWNNHLKWYNRHRKPAGSFSVFYGSLIVIIGCGFSISFEINAE